MSIGHSDRFPNWFPLLPVWSFDLDDASSDEGLSQLSISLH